LKFFFFGGAKLNLRETNNLIQTNFSLKIHNANPVVINRTPKSLNINMIGF